MTTTILLNAIPAVFVLLSLAIVCLAPHGCVAPAIIASLT